MSDYKLIDVTRLTKFKEKLLGILTYTSPAADATNTSIEFIDTVSQSNGIISASKKKVSTFASNTAGLVPAPGTNASGTFLGSDGKWSKPTGTTYSNYTYPTSTKVGVAGLVPAPGTGDVGKFLKGGSGWSDLPTASTATNGAGIVALSNSTNSTSTTIAATSKAVNDVYTAAVNAASDAGATAGASAASSYATAAKNSASNASTYATNAKNSADSAASAASTAVTNKIKNLKYDDPSASTATSTTFISNISQTNGVISATKKTLPEASTTNSGIVQLIDTTGSTSTTTAATPNSVTKAINDLTGSTTDSTTETSTTFISDISQTNGVISATKKKLPIFAGSSQPGIVSASEGLSENYLLNATGGWTAIDEVLDVTSTNPVQNKTLYNLETYHTVGVELKKIGIFNRAILHIMNRYGTEIDFSKLNNYTSIKCIALNDCIISNGLNDTMYSLNVRHGDSHLPIIVGFRSGVTSSNSGSAIYNNEKRPVKSKILWSVKKDNKVYNSTNIAFTAGATFEIIKINNEYYMLDDPVLIRYKYCNNEQKDEEGNYVYNYNRNCIVYASGLKMQWLSNIEISENGSDVILPVTMETTDYSITEARKGSNLADVTGYVEKHGNYFVVNPENDHIADFFIVGY